MRNLGKRKLSRVDIYIFASILILLILPICTCKKKNPTTPEPPDPPVEPTYYTVQLKYVRPPGSILRPDLVDKIVGVSVVNPNSSPDHFSFMFMDKTDDYNFNWSEPQQMPDNETSIIYSMWGIDPARWDGRDDSAVVGNTFFARVKETGFEKQLTNVMQNNNPRCPYPGPDARMVQWRLMKDGTIRDD